MSFEIKQFTPQEQQKYKEQFTMSEPTEWAVMDDGIVFSFYDTRGEAEEDLKGLIREDDIRDRFVAWRSEIVSEFGVSEGQVNEVVRSSVGEL